MTPMLVKVDVAADYLGRGARRVISLATEGRDLVEPGLEWVFDFASGRGGDAPSPVRGGDAPSPGIRGEAPRPRRELRYFKNELLEWPKPKARTLAQVLAEILPSRRLNFHVGEVCMMFQIRENTCRHLFTSNGRRDGRNFYSRAALAEFLKERWLGANILPQQTANNSNTRGAVKTLGRETAAIF